MAAITRTPHSTESIQNVPKHTDCDFIHNPLHDAAPESGAPQLGEKLQEQINDALRQSQEDWKNSDFSPFVSSDEDTDYELELYITLDEAGGDGLEAVKAALDQFNNFVNQGVDKVHLQHVLMRFLTHHPEVAKLNLYIPSLEERSPWKVASSILKAS